MNELPPPARLRLENQLAVVTGGTRGIGESIVRRFVQEGARVVFSGRSCERGKVIEENWGKTLRFSRQTQRVPLTPRR